MMEGKIDIDVVPVSVVCQCINKTKALGASANFDRTLHPVSDWYF
jgi:hypothetical protein